MNNFMKRLITSVVILSMCSGSLLACTNDTKEPENNGNKVEVEQEQELEKEEVEEQVKPETKPSKKPVEQITFEKLYDQMAVVMHSTLNVRKGPGVNYPKVATLIKNTIVVVPEKSSNGWYKVILDGKELGYVSGQYIKLQDEYFRYLLRDMQIEGAHIVRKGEQVKIVGISNNKLVAKHNGVSFEIDTNSLTTVKPQEVVKPEVKPEPETKPEPEVKPEPETKPEPEVKPEQQDEIIGSYTTYYNQNQVGRSENIRLAANTINITLQPGEEFKWSKVVGQATAAKGYQPAPIYVGNQVVQGVGGGVCQVSSTLYNAVLEAGLKVTERHQHSLPVSYVPAGRDATVSYGSLDFRFVNNTDKAIKIVAGADSGAVSVMLMQ